MRFFDRQAELGRLESLLRRKQGALAVVWGRRRVGKTRLLLEWCRKTGGLYTVADQSAEAVQRQYFAESLAVRFPSLAEARYPDWRALLRGRSTRSGRSRGRRGRGGRRRHRCARGRGVVVLVQKQDV